MTTAGRLLSRLPRRPGQRSVPGPGGSLPRLEGPGRLARLVRPPGPLSHPTRPGRLYDRTARVTRRNRQLLQPSPAAAGPAGIHS